MLEIFYNVLSVFYNALKVLEWGERSIGICQLNYSVSEDLSKYILQFIIFTDLKNIYIRRHEIYSQV